ncbi:MAG: tetratricopeptide repeat protein, partial [Candidatus Dormibacteria bacterium]
MADVGDHARTKLELVQDAVQMALSARWEEAVSANLEIQERFGEDEETANRLGKALIETGRFDEAREAYRRALALNPLNQIAKRQLAKLDELMEGRAAAVPGEASLPPRFFTEEPGKTTMTRLSPPARVDPA